MSNPMSPIYSFKFAADNLHYYQSVLIDHGVDAASITDIESFTKQVPIISKLDIFPKFNADQLFTKEQLDNFSSAIVSSGTSGIFSYGLVSKSDSERQSQMLDGLISQFFQLQSEDEVVIINALPMGVSFSSSHPVVPVSTRTDIALHIIKTFGKSRQILIVTEPRLLRQLVEQGDKQGLDLSQYSVSAIVGGMWFPQSLTSYLVKKLNKEILDESQVPKNQVLTTMGITEIGLNLFTATPDLVKLRSDIQNNLELAYKLFATRVADPVLGYTLSSNFYYEIVNQDDNGIGELVVTHLDTDAAPFLIRYNTGDRIKLLSDNELKQLSFEPVIQAPIFAIYGRTSDLSDLTLSKNDIQQIYYQSADLVRCGTDNFHIEKDNGLIIVYYQLKQDVDLVSEVEIDGVIFRAVPHFEYHQNMGLQFDYKWKH